MRYFLSTVFVAVILTISVGLSSIAQAQDASTSPAAEQAKALVEVLRDDKARGALIGELERLASEDNTASPASAADAGDPSASPVGEEEEPAQVSLGRQLALFTQDAAQSLAEGADTLWQRLSELPMTLSALDGAENATVLFDALKNLALTILVTYALFILLRRVARPLFRRMGRTASGVGSTATFFLIFASTIIDILIVAIAWAAGYAITTLFFGAYGEIGIRQTLYLNAFLVVEMVKVILRFVMSPTTGDLRLIAITDRAAKYLTRWLTVIISILGYGQLLIIPIINQNVSFLAGRAMSATLSLIVLLLGLVLVLRNRKRVANWLTDAESHPGQGGLLRWLAQHWHWPVMLYLAALFVIVVTRPDGMLFPVLGASGKILLAILIGMITTGAITRGISHGVQVPKNVSARLPLLEGRLNRFVPTSLMIVRMFVVLGVIAFAANVIGLIDLSGWLESEAGIDTTSTVFATFMIVFMGFALWLALTSWIDYRLNPEFGHIPTAREMTLLSLLRNAATIAILIITLMFALSEMGVDIAPLLASAGVLGLAIGFGAQKLVQDIITGVFIQFESAINVGDVITVSGTTGTVERLTIRSVSLRDLHGVYHIIPFSSVDMVSNFMREFSYFVCDMGVAYREQTDEVREAMLDAYDELAKDKVMARDFLGKMEWMGVTSFGDNAVGVRTRLKTRPGKQWAIGRAYNAVVKRIFDERGIEMPFPHRTLYFGEDKDGSAPAATLKINEHRIIEERKAPTTRTDRKDDTIDAPPESEDAL